MDRAYDKQTAMAEYVSEFNFDDQRELETTNTSMHNTCTEFVRQAEVHEINPNPIPHAHTPHEEKATFCKAASWFFTVVGVVVTILLTATAVDWPLAGAVAATAAFLMLEFGVKLGISAAVPEKMFARRFHTLYWPWLGILLGSVAVLWLGRNAGPDLAALLMKYSTVGWCGAEVALLFLGAYAFVGRRRFGWSGDAVRRVAELEARVAELTKRIDRRNGKLLAGVLVFLCLGATSVRAACPLVLLDRSGSLAEQDRAENRLVEALAANAHLIPCIRLAAFAARALSAEAVTIEFSPPGAATHDVFRSVIEARRIAMRDVAKVKLQAVLNAGDRKPAVCTSMTDVAARALMDAGPVLVVTDGVHDCAPSRPVLPPQSSAGIFIVLVPSKGDQGNEFEVFSKRAAALRRLLPQARIFLDGQLAEAVAAWAAAPGAATFVKALW